MKITISQEVLKMLPDDLSLILALNDGSNQFSNAQGCCMIGDRFLVIPVAEPVAPFNVPIPSDSLPVFISNYEKIFLSGHLVLTKNSYTGNLVLKNEGGVLDTNVELRPTLATV